MAVSPCRPRPSATMCRYRKNLSKSTVFHASMASALREHDPQALVLPFCMSGGTDAKAFTPLGIACYGFAPGSAPPGFSYGEYVHGVDEHIPIETLTFGVKVLDTFLRTDPRENR